MTDTNKTSDKIALYSIKGIKGRSQIKIKPMGMILAEEQQLLRDLVVHSFNPEKSVNASVHLCYITGNFLLSTKKLPVMYTKVVYEKPLKTFNLYKLFLYFTIEKDITSEKQLINSEIYGKFSLELHIKENVIELDNNIENFSGNTKIFELFEQLAKSEEINDLTTDIVTEELEKLTSEYKKEFDYFNQMPKATLSLKDYL